MTHDLIWLRRHAEGLQASVKAPAWQPELLGCEEINERFPPVKGNQVLDSRALEIQERKGFNQLVILFGGKELQVSGSKSQEAMNSN